jgi:hypothetical protein
MRDVVSDTSATRPGKDHGKITSAGASAASGHAAVGISDRLRTPVAVSGRFIATGATIVGEVAS